MTPEKLSAWRIVPRMLILSYMLVFYQTCTWFMNLADPNNAQAGFVSVIVGAGAAWFGIYVNGTRTSVSVSAKTEQRENL
jgi:membrane associated rhomboid family serine protease